jgi:hypothetical protein
LLDSKLLPYIFFFLVAGIPALLFGKRWNKFAWPAAWLVFVIFVGLRHRIGGDWGSYIRINRNISEMSFMEAIGHNDSLFSVLSWVSSGLGLGVYGTNFVGAIIFCTGLFSYCARLPNRWLALCAATPFLVVASVMSASRQGIAVGVFFLVLAYWKELSMRGRVFGIIVAGFFHTSAFVTLTLAIVDLRIGVIRKSMLAILAGAGTFWLMSISETGLDQYTRIYVTEQETEASGAVLHLSLNLLPALAMLITRKWWAKRLSSWPLLRVLCLLAIALAVLVPFYTQAVSRMSLYLFPISITFFGCLPLMLKSSASRAFVRFGSVTLLLVVLTVWVGFSNQSFAYLPYRNVLTTSFNDLDLPQ